MNCYFIIPVLEDAFKDPAKAKYLNEDAVRRWFGFGGVRLEDDVLVTPTGIENLTCCPRSVADIEAVMASSP